MSGKVESRKVKENKEVLVTIKRQENNFCIPTTLVRLSVSLLQVQFLTLPLLDYMTISKSSCVCALLCLQNGRSMPPFLIYFEMFVQKKAHSEGLEIVAGKMHVQNVEN